jgi:2-C-methyl-D-erythritol 4-phosphate cytidylyltransferase
MAEFSVLVLTAPPPGQAAEAGGAFTKIDGREALLRSVELFLNRDNVKQVQLVIDPEHLEEAKRKYGPHLSFSGVKLLSGGPKWMDQIKAAKEKISTEVSHVILHDAARPIVAYSDIDNLMTEAEQRGAVALVSPSRGTLAEVDEGGNALAYHLPTSFVNLVTPWAFNRATFLEMASSGQQVHPSKLTLIKGSPLNLRIGGSGEAGMAKALLSMLPKPKVKPPSSPFEEAQW